MHEHEKRAVGIEEAVHELGLFIKEPGVFLIAGMLIKIIGDSELHISYIDNVTGLPQISFPTNVTVELTIKGRIYQLHTQQHELIIEELVKITHPDY